MNDLEKIKEKSNSYLTFKLDDEIFASHVSHIINILEVPTITKVPKMPDYMLGVMNLRGNVLPVFDTCLKFGLSKTNITSNTCVLVTEIQMEGSLQIIGILVDGVQEVLEFSADQILAPPTLNMNMDASFIYGVVNLDDKFIMLLDMNLIFNSIEIKDLTKQMKPLVKEEI